MSGTLQAPQFSPVVNDVYFQQVWADFFDSLTSAVNAAAPLASPTFTGTVTVPALTVTGAATLGSTVAITGAATLSSSLQVTGPVGFSGNSPVSRQTVTGSRGNGTALNNLLNIRQVFGLITNGSTT